MAILEVDRHACRTKKTCATNVLHQLSKLNFGLTAFVIFVASFVRSHDGLSLANSPSIAATIFGHPPNHLAN